MPEAEDGEKDLSLAQDVATGGYETDVKQLERGLRLPTTGVRRMHGGGRYEMVMEEGSEYWWVKFRREESGTIGDDQLRAELIAQRIYRRLGFNVPEVHLLTLEGRLALASREIPGLSERVYLKSIAGNDEVRHGMLVDVYLNNWDIPNNIGVAQGRVIRLESGSALDSRARGMPKPFGPLYEINIRDFRDPAINYAGSELYSAVTREDLIYTAEMIAGLSNEEIASIVKAVGYKDEEKEIRIISTLIRRREEIKKLFGIRAGEEEEAKEDDEEVWRRLEALRPEDARLNRVLSEIEEFDQKILTPHLESAAVVDQALNSLALEEREVVLEGEFIALIDQISAIKKSIERVEILIQSGGNPTITIGGGGGRIDSLKWKVKGYREKKLTEARRWCQRKREEIDLLYSLGTAKLASRVEFSLKRVEEDDSYQRSLSPSGRSLLSDVPFPVQRLARSLSEAQEALAGLRQYVGSTGVEKPETQRQIGELEKRIRRETQKLTTFWEDQTVVIVEASFNLVERVPKTLSPGEGLGLLESLMVAPSERQTTVIANFCGKVRRFFGDHEELMAHRRLKRERLLKVEDTVDSQRKLLRRRCEQIRTDLVCHMTLTQDEYARRILREGYLISSLGQRKIRGEAHFNSPAGERRLLPEVTFSIDGAELQYGGTGSKVIGRERRHLGVGFVFPYTTVVGGGRVFYEQTSSQAQGPDHYHELHVFHPEYDGTYQREDWEHAEVRVDIEDGIFIAPEVEREEWTAFLLRPKSEGGVGKDRAWVEEHVRFYPSYTRPNDFVEFGEAYGFSLPRSELGILVPTRRKGIIGGADTPTPLFKWVSAKGLE